MKQNLNDGIAAHEYDVVSFFENKVQKGNVINSISFKGGNYFFSSLENKEKFLEDPEKYLPQYGGYCAIAMSEEKLVDPNPKSWEIRDNKLYFFTRKLFGIIDARRQWLRDPENKRKLADTAWEKLSE